ncbi:IS701 family transposase [Streptomyces sp. URMC 123]|uniref:IS701 family transposase n=1 Tax=Streptomyces sp. URMC 123 TaxID=3423403 RepID=UPI003F1A245E
MSGVALFTGDKRQAHAPAQVSAHDVVLAELCAGLFGTLPRSDQRRKGMDYIRGLLGAPGRKSIRNIAALIGGHATEQSLHHFISSSTWDWTPVRRALAQHLARIAPPQAWVVRPMVIPKAGENSVGVDRRFFPDLGQVLNAQQAIGVWSASEDLCAPVNWRLHLSGAWLEDSGRRSRASIPDGVAEESLGDCAVEAYLGMMSDWQLPIRPVVLDAREGCAVTTARRLGAAGVPMLIRVSSTLRLSVVDRALPASGGEALPAHQIMGLARDMRRPVVWSDARAGGGLRSTLAAAVRVRVPSRTGQPVRPPRLADRGPAQRRGELLLLGIGEPGRRGATELWLTDMMGVQPAALVRLSRLMQRVDRDFTEIADQVGIRDFAGRSFSGWHRHVTLASAAHAVAALARASEVRPAGERPMRYAS